MTEPGEMSAVIDARDETEICPIALSLDVLGQKWTILIVREALRGARRFSEFHEALGCPRNLLAARLRLLCDSGVLRLVPYAVPGQRTREQYELTPAGEELAPTLIALFDWGTRHTSVGDAMWAQPSRCACGAQLHVALECEAGHRLTTPETIVFPRRSVARAS